MRLVQCWLAAVEDLGRGPQKICSIGTNWSGLWLHKGQGPFLFGFDQDEDGAQKVNGIVHMQLQL